MTHPVVYTMRIGVAPVGGSDHRMWLGLRRYCANLTGQTAGLALPLMAVALLHALPIPLAFLRRGFDARNGPAPGRGAIENKRSNRK